MQVEDKVILNAYDRNPVVKMFPNESLTEQHHKDEVDINNVVRRYDKQGVITHVNKARAMYGDFTEVNEYQDALNTVIQAQDAFAELPIRS